jgi:hypothetical protein
MSFREFTYPDVCEKLALKPREADLYHAAAPFALPPEFTARLFEDAEWAYAVFTEKARSECIIAPILLEMRRRLGKSFELFSGVELNVDPARGLNGVCDFLLTKSGLQTFVRGPLVAIAEAKNNTLREGFGQGIASMVAAQVFNQQHGKEVPVIHGVVTTGSAWKFLRLTGDELTIDLPEYYIDNVEKIAGILKTIIDSV